MDAWRVKCSSSPWTSPPPPSSLPAPPPLRPLVPPQVPTPSSANQMNKNPRQPFHPFIVQGANVESRPAVQEPLVFHTLNLDFATKSGKTELGNSFLALLSANPQHLPSEFSQPAKFHAHTGGNIIVSSASPGAQVTSIASLAAHSTSGIMWNANIPSFVQSRQSLMTNSTKAPAYNSVRVATSHCNASAFTKPVPDQAFRGAGAGKPFISSSWSSTSRPENASQLHPFNIQTSQRMPTEGGSAVPCHDSARSRGRPRVICMNSVGELFLSEYRLLGVICFCHGLRMSVAKFCEHSGSSANPGEVVCLENGMTVARWRKLCFGNNAPDDCKGWDWSDSPSSKTGFIGSKGSTSPTLPQNPGTVDSVRTFVGLHKSGDPRNKTLYAKPPGTGVPQAAIKNPLSNVSDNMYQRNSLEKECFTSQSQSHVPVLAKDHIVHATKESPDYSSPEASRAALNKGEQNAWSRLVTNTDNCKAKLGTPSLLYPHSDAKSLGCEFNSSRNSFGSEAFVLARDGRSSNIDLRLGQPSQGHTSLSSLSRAMNPLQFGAARNHEKSQVNFPLTEKTDYPIETRQPRTGLWCASSEPSISNRGQSQHGVGSSKNSNHSESKDLTGTATKNSLISLFLSHLNSGGSSTSQLTTVVNDSKYSMLDSAVAKCHLSECINDIHCGNQRDNIVDGSDLSNNIYKGKRPEHFENGSCDTANANYMVNNKQTADSRFLMPATGGQCLYGGSSVDQRRFSLHFDQPSGILQTGSDSMNFNQYEKIPTGTNRDHCSHATNSSMNLVSYAAARPDHINSGTPKNLTSSNSLYISETTSAVTHTKSIDHSQHLTDDNLKFLALRHMVELSKQEQSSAILEASPRQKRLCCHSGIELQRNLCKGDSAAAEDLRQGTSAIQQNASEFTVRSLQSCTNCFSGNGGEMLAAKTGTRGNEYCKCTTLTQRISLCSKEHDISTCHVCCADEHSHLRLGRISNYSPGSVKQIFDQKEQFTSFYGKCCCSMLSKQMPGCCLTGHFSPSDSDKQNVRGKAVTMHITEACDESHRSQDGGNVDLCECTKKHFVMKNDCKTGLWRDVPAKKIGHSDATSVDKAAQMLKASEGTGDQHPGTACKGFERSQQEFDLMNEEQMSNVCSGTSAPAVTELSVEVNKVNYCATNVKDNKTSYDLADEGSGVGKCGSSDEALDIRECDEDYAVNGKVDPAKSGCSLPSQTSGDFMDELRLETSSNKEKVRKKMHVQCADQENNKTRKVWKTERRKEQLKMNKLDMSVPKLINSESYQCISHLNWEFTSPDKSKAPSQPETMMQKSSLKRKRSSLSSIEPLSSMSKSHHNILEFDKKQSVNDHQSLKTVAVSSGKEELTVHRERQFAKQDGIHLDSEKPPKYMSLSRIAKSNNHEEEIVDKKVRPVVCGKSGIISNGGLSVQKKPPKIVPLSLILKRSKRCDVNEYGAKPKKSSTLDTRKMRLKGNNGCCNELSSSKLHCENEDSKRNGTCGTTVHMCGTNKRCSSKSDEHVDGFSMIENEADGGNNKEEEPVLHHRYKIFQTRPRYREARKCSLSKLLGKDKHATMPPCKQNSGASCGSTINGKVDKPKAYDSSATSDSLIDVALGKRSLHNEDHAGELSQINTRSGKIRKCQPSFLKSDAFCCVCGSSNKEEFNCILECNCCLVRVHQACYGISKVPRGHWFCRPCKTNSLNTVCVLCGYEGGAMTKAVKSQNIVKSLLKSWNFGSFRKSISSCETVKGESSEPCFVIEASTDDNSGSVTAARSVCTDAFLEAAVDLISENQTSDRMLKGLQPYNSITAGVLDPSVTQWVHMVCGLWTPGTRCPNVDTMSAFDVSGASAARKSTVCSMCNRPGGCCIQCRVMKCSVHFHPWCAHQKGLLQSEIESDDNEKVGFYGRCMLHAAQDGIHVDSNPLYTEAESPKKDWSCARTEGFKGRKSEGFKPNHWRPPNNDNGGCIVSQDQINAWLHINGQKSCTRTVVKLPSSDVEHDFRKEYFRYKQSKAWKHLVVYKSGIHALGLYTSQLIARGAMVVEYVGEIVGLRVADKREIEYQSGRRLQYKSACYFFRIDKEHIIDATRKGGIARFVNHSCQPNCVAKVISVRNEKKVVFFAERDINPGEEITYDYHFNREDEGQKIPCYCNSKNCRRFLN